MIDRLATADKLPAEIESKGDRASTEASLKYLILATIGSGFVLLAIGMLYICLLYTSRCV